MVFRNKLARCNKCGSYETNSKPYDSTDSTIQCFNCGTIQLGKLDINHFVQYNCSVCTSDITRITKDLIPIWYIIKRTLTDSKYICDYCYEMWKIEIFKHEDNLREILRNEENEIAELKEKNHLQELNSMSKEDLIKKILELESEPQTDYD